MKANLERWLWRVCKEAGQSATSDEVESIVSEVVELTKPSEWLSASWSAKHAGCQPVADELKRRIEMGERR